MGKSPCSLDFPVVEPASLGVSSSNMTTKSPLSRSRGRAYLFTGNCAYLPMPFAPQSSLNGVASSLPLSQLRSKGAGIYLFWVGKQVNNTQVFIIDAIRVIRQVVACFHALVIVVFVVRPEVPRKCRAIRIVRWTITDEKQQLPIIGCAADDLGGAPRVAGRVAIVKRRLEVSQ